MLAIFVIDLQFLAGRYVGLILLLATPFVAAGLQWGSQRFRHANAITIVLCLVLAAGNVISTGAGKGAPRRGRQVAGKQRYRRREGLYR